MTRLIFWIALIVLVVMAVRSKLRAVTAPRPPEPNPQPGGHRGVQGNWQRVQDQSERMSCCAQCGIYFPASEAVAAGGREYCCAAHAHAHANR